MTKTWTDDAWEDYLYWQSQDRKTLKRINQLILDIDRNGYKGIGKPEPLKHELSGSGAGELMIATVLCIVSKKDELRLSSVEAIIEMNNNIYERF